MNAIQFWNFFVSMCIFLFWLVDAIFDNLAKNIQKLKNNYKIIKNK